MEQAAINQMQQTVSMAKEQKPVSSPTVPTTPTTEENSQDQSLFDSLSKKHQIAVKLKLQGCTYYMIADEISKTYNHVFEDTVAHWFSKSGICHEVYTTLRQRALTELNDNINNVQTELKQGALDAMGVIRKAARGEDVSDTQLSAAKDLLDRAGFPKITKQELAGKLETPGLTAVAEGIKAILERRPAPQPVKPVTQ